MRSSISFLILLIIIILIYSTLVRRYSPKLFVTESDVDALMQNNHTIRGYQRRIPRIIHQTWRNATIPVWWNSSTRSVRQLNSNEFEYRLWTDKDMNEFVREKVPELYQNTFLTYSYNIQRVDAFRYILLYYLGGVYIDMDIGCSKSLDILLNTLEALDSEAKHLAAFPATKPIGVSNDFMISTKNHPLLGQLVFRLPFFNHNYIVYYLTVMLSAGPLYVTLNEHLFRLSSSNVSVRIIDGSVYSSLFLWFARGNSWHGRDARVIINAYEILHANRSALLAFCLPFVFCIIFLRLFKRNRFIVKRIY